MNTLVLDLCGQCIETAARAEYRRLSKILMRSESRLPASEQPAELLREFLVATDFRALRAQRPELAGGAPITVRITLESGGCFAVRVLPGSPADPGSDA